MAVTTCIVMPYEHLLMTSVKSITFSGTTKSNTVGVSRKIIGYRNGFEDKPYETQSNASGTWSLDMSGGSNDKFRIIAVGEGTENSQIYDGLHE